jgi:hypothetical protein
VIGEVFRAELFQQVKRLLHYPGHALTLLRCIGLKFALERVWDFSYFGFVRLNKGSLETFNSKADAQPISIRAV